MWEKVTKDGAPGKVLLVHHEWRIARQIATNLTRLGHHVVIVKDCDTASEKMAEQTFDSIVIDAALPPVRCAAALELLKTNAHLDEMEVFVLGADDTDVEGLQRLDKHPIHILSRKK